MAIRTKADLGRAVVTLAERRQLTKADLKSRSGLGKGTVYDFCLGHGTQTWTTLEALLRACEITDERALVSWKQTLERVHRYPAPTIGDLDPVNDLHVLEAVDLESTETRSGSDLTPYIERSHDHELRAALRGTIRNAFVLLVGDVATGKTRSAREAVLAELPHWPVFVPRSSSDLLDRLVDPVVRGGVVWIDRAQDFLTDDASGAEVTRVVNELLSVHPRSGTMPTVLIGTMRREDEWLPLYRGAPGDLPPGASRAHREALARLLQRQDSVFPVADTFNIADEGTRRELDLAAVQDRRMALATGNRATRVTQNLTGGPALLNVHRAREGTALHVAVSVAVDAYRCGHTTPLSADTLNRLTDAHLNDEQRATTKDFASVLGEIARPDRGVRAFTPIATVGSDELRYRLHPYLVSHAIRNEPPTENLWQTLIRSASAEDLTRLAQTARLRLLFRHAEEIYRRLLKEQPIDVSTPLASLLIDQGRIDEACSELERAIGRGATPYDAIDSLRDNGFTETAISLLQALVDAGHCIARRRLAGVLRDRNRPADRQSAINLLRPAARAGDISCFELLGDILAAANPSSVAEIDVISECASVRWRGVGILDRHGHHALAIDLMSHLLESGVTPTSMMSVSDALLDRIEAGRPALLRLLAEHGDMASIQRLRIRNLESLSPADLEARCNAGEKLALRQRAQIAARAGDKEYLDTLTKGGDPYARWELILHCIANERTAEAIERLDTWLREDGATWPGIAFDALNAGPLLARLVAEHEDDEALRQLARRRVPGVSRSLATRWYDKDDLDALRLLEPSSDRYVNRRIADLLARHDRVDELMRMAEHSGAAAKRLHELQVDRAMAKDLATLRRLTVCGDQTAADALRRLIKAGVEDAELEAIRRSGLQADGSYSPEQ